MIEVLLVRILTQTVRIYDEFGQDACEAATHQALVAMARSLQALATSKAGTASGKSNVVPFPHRGKYREFEQIEQDDA